MKVYKTEIVPAKAETTKEICVGRACDLCGRKAESGDRWSASSYAMDETTVTVNITCATGKSYPEFGSGLEWDIDLCPECFVNKLVPWLNAQGANVSPNKVDW